MTAQELIQSALEKNKYTDDLFHIQTRYERFTFFLYGDDKNVFCRNLKGKGVTTINSGYSVSSSYMMCVHKETRAPVLLEKKDGYRLQGDIVLGDADIAVLLDNRYLPGGKYTRKRIRVLVRGSQGTEWLNTTAFVYAPVMEAFKDDIVNDRLQPITPIVAHDKNIGTYTMWTYNEDREWEKALAAT